jgi:hypothetical protein
LPTPFGRVTSLAGYALGLGLLSLLMAPSADAQHYLVNGHPATAGDEQIPASYGFDAGGWRIDGWGISQDVVLSPRGRPLSLRARRENVRSTDEAARFSVSKAGFWP